MSAAPLASERVREVEPELLALRPRLALSHEERLRYFENIAAHRPFELELLRWNHDRPREKSPAEQGVVTDQLSQDGTGRVSPGQQGLEEVEDEEEEHSDHTTFEQLQCLTGQHRCCISGEHGLGIHWMDLELAGVFLRHRHASALVWLPEAGPNFLLQPAPSEPWELLEVARLGKETVVVEEAKNRAEGKTYAMYGNVAVHRSWRKTARRREADPHLTDHWLQAAEDMRSIWPWGWRPVREMSPFEIAHAKFVYNVNYPLADKFTRGVHGEERWLWQWREDGHGSMVIQNRSWRDGASLVLSECEAVYTGLGDERYVWPTAFGN